MRLAALRFGFASAFIGAGQTIVLEAFAFGFAARRVLRAVNFPGGNLTGAARKKRSKWKVWIEKMLPQLTKNGAAVDHLHQKNDLANHFGKSAALVGTEIVHRFGIWRRKKIWRKLVTRLNRTELKGRMSFFRENPFRDCFDGFWNFPKSNASMENWKKKNFRWKIK